MSVNDTALGVKRWGVLVDLRRVDRATLPGGAGYPARGFGGWLTRSRFQWYCARCCAMVQIVARLRQNDQPKKSRKGTCALLGVAFLAVFGLLIWHSHSARDPVIDGRPLSAWFGDFVHAHAVSRESPPQSIEVFRKGGSDGVAFLIRKLNEKSELGEKYVRLKSVLPGWAFKVLPTVELGNWGDRECAAILLGEIGLSASNAVPELIGALTKAEVHEADKSKGESDGKAYNDFARAQAIRALSKIAPDSPEVVSALIDALKQKYLSPVADVAAEALIGLGPEFKSQIPRMIANLKYQDQMQFRGAGISAIYSVGSLAPGYGEHVPRLIDALKDPAPETRDAAAYDLGALRPADREKAKAALPALEEALRDSQALIRIRVSETILAIDAKQSKTVLPTLINLLSETNYLVRLRAIDLLRQIGTDAKGAVPSLTNALQAGSRTIQTWAGEALKRIDPEPAMNGVVK
jgi:HEAT repeat protein